MPSLAGCIGALIVAAYSPFSWAQVPETENEVPVLSPVKVIGQASDDGGYASGSAVGSKETATPREIANSVSVITRQRINDQNLVTVDQALGQVTGVTVISNDTTQSQYRSRGYAMGVAYDGVPSYNNLGGFQQFDLSVYERVEVLRGPAGIFQGSGEPGGIVNLVRKRAKETFEASGLLGVGSWNDRRTELDVTGPINAEKTVRARAVLSTSNRDYFYDTTHTDKWLAYGTLDWDITSATTLSLAVTQQDDKTDASYMGLPAWASGELLDAPRETNPSPDWNRYIWNTKEYVAELEHRYDNEWVGKVKFNRREQSFYFKDAFIWTGVDPASHTVSYRRRISDYDYTRNAVDVYATGPFTLFGRRHHALLGYNYENYLSENVGLAPDTLEGIPFGRPDLVPEIHGAWTSGGKNETSQRGFYGQVRLKVAEPLTVVLGGRLSWFNNKSRSVAPSVPTAWSQGAKEHQHFTPYAAVTYDVGRDITVYGSYASIFVPLTNTKADGSVLKPREGRQTELGIKSEFLGGRLQASAAIFDLRDRNRAYADGAGFFVNAGEVQSRGWEVEVSGRPAPGYEIQAGYTRLETKYLKDAGNEGLPSSTWEPRHTARLWGVRKFADGALKGLGLGLGVHIASENKSGNGSLAMRRQGGYAVVNALVSYKLNNHATVQLNANNLFDRTYYTRLGGLNTYNSYGEPRNFMLTLRAHY
ncbi:outer-membrane receptor for ferric coprogen and ferric-rhodotorulic acid [Pollutimonas bauzanensis]|uniref:Outer-membrane receptor for ferric coprogen and ferric-rhodotorulic acid n=2 Tax=Pollutimonas bauzanensis TaxID=658167 RepID=A0A1M5YYK1_9BURK|nr:outer-membrane receptor for ferric coprogen and ferric-rhodotorulic acid [Pollutimonas bauzanensis]